MSPDTIYARRTRFAYGVRVAKAFKPGMRQDLRFVEPTTNKVHCNHYFSSLVKLDELVEHDQVIELPSFRVTAMLVCLLSPHKPFAALAVSCQTAPYACVCSVDLMNKTAVFWGQPRSCVQ